MLQIRARVEFAFATVVFFVADAYTSLLSVPESMHFTSPALATDKTPRVFLLDGAALLESQRRLLKGDKTLEASLSQLISEADAKLEAGPFSVMDKEVGLKDGDKHNYFSMAPYFWPNPGKANGLPYMSKDGHKNPERYQIGDFSSFISMKRAVVTLSYAWFFTGSKDYAQQACSLLRVWFLDRETRMNPHLDFAQGVPGKTDGRTEGIVDWKNMPLLVDAIGLLGTASCWRPEDQQGMVQWFDDFLQWLLNSKHGQQESDAQSNQGTQYDVQVASYALFVDKPEVAHQVLQQVPKRRIDSQIKPDGSQPKEQSRENGWDYSCDNLGHFLRLAQLGRHVDVDLLAYKKDGRSIKQVVRYLLPYATGESAWPHNQLHSVNPSRLQKALIQAPVDMGCTAMAYKLWQVSGVEELLHPYHAAGVDDVDACASTR